MGLVEEYLGWLVFIGVCLFWEFFVVKFGVGLGMGYENSYVFMDGLSLVLVMMGFMLWVFMAGVYGGGLKMGVFKEMGFSLILCVLVSLVFVVDSWVAFYVLYEGSMLPLLVGVLLYGGYYERVGSVFYLVIYMVLFSSPLVVMLLMCYSVSGDLKIGVWELISVNASILVLLVMGVLVKVPMFGVHSWLPKVHVEAPTWGSVILAAVMIKMGVYGLWRMVNESLWVSGVSEWLWLWSFVGVVMMALMCLMSVDLKVIVAYSSVVHMGGLVWLSGFSVVSGWRGVLIMSVMHGMISGGMFVLVGSLGDVFQTRSVLVLKGVVDFLGFLGILVVVLFVLNVGFPLSGNMLGELEVMMSVWSLWKSGWVVFGAMMFLGCFFNLYVLMTLYSSGSSEAREMVGGVLLSMSMMVFVSVVGLVVFGSVVIV
uniref:NADH-ubiquinone oxidoreductase chain 4 n=1 Tax=Southwellina hispida TaxID=449650 RepID=A0A0C4MW48_9BILA|nr:NADH dehydrogenase subunit 4 [Southwellina hispida]AIO11161.1 NADH dehydrogenase subunit 4 [Southwellina hispida]